MSEMSMAGQQIEEQKLIQQAQGGDVEAFNQLVLRYQDRIYSVAYRIMGNAASAADATQDAFLSAYEKLNSYRGGSFLSWLARIVTNICYDELRRQKRRPATSFEDLPDADFDDGPALATGEATPEEITLNSELGAAIQRCIGALGEDQRFVLVLCDVQGLSYQEVAEALDLNIGTVKSRLSRARYAIRQCLQAVRELLPDAFRLDSNSG